MSILLGPFTEPEGWIRTLRAELPDLPIQPWPDVPDPDSVQFAVFWLHEPEDLHRYPNLKAILSVTAGVEQFLEGNYPDVPIVRMSDPAMADEMAAYAVHWVVHFHRRMDIYARQQADKLWQPRRLTGPEEYPVGLLGFGVMGRRIGETLTGLGYPVRAWSRTGGRHPTIEQFHGSRGLETMLASCQAIINVLPFTPSTEGLMDAHRFACFREGSLYISIGRGLTTVEYDLVAALDHGPLQAAVLDVTTTEPLPAGSPLWNHPQVRITPHVSGFTRPATAAPVVATNIRRIQRGEQPFPLYDPDRGY